VPDPTPRNVGVVTIMGVATEPGSAPVSMAPDPPKYFYQPNADVKTSFSAVSRKEPTCSSAPPAPSSPPSRSPARGIRLLDVPSEAPITVAKGKPLPVRWQAPGRADLTRVEVTVDISHHGGFKGAITCDTADSGSLDIPAVLVGKLIDLGVAGFPTVAVVRRATSNAQAGLRARGAERHVRARAAADRGWPHQLQRGPPLPGGADLSQNQLCR
jgi:hypothetical protein